MYYKNKFSSYLIKETKQCQHTPVRHVYLWAVWTTKSSKSHMYTVNCKTWSSLIRALAVYRLMTEVWILAWLSEPWLSTGKWQKFGSWHGYPVNTNQTAHASAETESMLGAHVILKKLFYHWNFFSDFKKKQRKCWWLLPGREEYELDTG